MDVDEHDGDIYLVDDFQDDDSDMDSVHTHTTGFTEHTMSTLTSDAATGTSLHVLDACRQAILMRFLLSEYFQEVNGRMFPLDENLPFLFPADNAEVRRLEIQHEAVKLLLRGNYYGPVKEVLGDLEPDGRRKRVLDLITGEGRWYVRSWRLVRSPKPSLKLTWRFALSSPMFQSITNRFGPRLTYPARTLAGVRVFRLGSAKWPPNFPMSILRASTTRPLFHTLGPLMYSAMRCTICTTE